MSAWDFIEAFLAMLGFCALVGIIVREFRSPHICTCNKPDCGGGCEPGRVK